jgi:hypothetical protein
MASVHAGYLTEAEAYELALPVLRKNFKPFGFEKVSVKEVEELDGTAVFRMVAHVKTRVPARLLIDATQDIRQVLRKRGEERFVFLRTERPGDEDIDEDEE